VDDSEAVGMSYWTVCGKYRVIGNLIYEDGDDRVSYIPLRDPDLFLSFARLGAHGEPSVSSIMRWVSKYGLLTLGGDRQLGYYHFRDFGQTWLEDGVGWEVPEQDAITVDAFRAEVSKAYELLTVYTEINSRDAEAIRTRAAWPKSSLDQHLGTLLPTQHEDSPHANYVRYVFVGDWDMSEDDADLYMALSVLTAHATTLVSDVQPHMRFTEPDMIIMAPEGHMFLNLKSPNSVRAPKVSLSWRCPSLLSAIYMQFCLLLADSRPMRRCENPACGMPFPINRKGKRFCNSTCRSNARHYRR
jgi:hypothetical protein